MSAMWEKFLSLSPASQLTLRAAVAGQRYAAEAEEMETPQEKSQAPTKTAWEGDANAKVPEKPLEPMTLESEPDRTIAAAGHIFLIFCLYALLAAYFGYTLYVFVTKTPATHFRLEPTLRHSPVQLELWPECTPSCGDIHVLVNYSGIPECGNRVEVLDFTHTTAFQSFDVCYVDDIPYSSTVSGPLIGLPGILVTFTNFSNPDAFGTLRLRAKSASSPFALNKQLTVTGEMVKSVNMGLHITIDDGDVTDKVPYFINYQMEGSRLDKRSDVHLLLSQSASVQEKESSVTVIGYLAELGNGVLFLLSIITTFFVPFVSFAFAVKTGTPAVV